MKQIAAGEAFEDVVPALAKTLFRWSDVIHSHGPLRLYAPTGTFCFTVLRDPIQRLLSQVSDWRRLNTSDTIDGPPELHRCVEDSRRLPLRDFLEEHGEQAGRRFLDNYMTRALAAGRMGNRIYDVTDPDRLSEVAFQSLEKDYDLVGLTEDMDLSRNALCGMVGLPPARKIPTINATRAPSLPDPELHGLWDILQRLTRVDRAIYNRARQLFDRRHRQLAETYDATAFETQHADRLLSEARGFAFGDATRYSVRAPIIGSGFHGRDGAGQPSCAVWSGPETLMKLYIPTPSDMQLSLLVWIRGYVEGRQREELHVRVDGAPVAHHFEAADGYADMLVIDTFSTRNFVCLEIDINETLESGDPASDHYDARERGISFDSYGWRPIY